MKGGTTQAGKKRHDQTNKTNRAGWHRSVPDSFWVNDGGIQDSEASMGLDAQTKLKVWNYCQLLRPVLVPWWRNMMTPLHKGSATRLTDLASKWLKGCVSVQEVVDAVVKKQLLQTLPEDVWIWVSKRKPATSAEVGQLAEDYLPRRQLSSGSRSRRGQMGDRSQDTISMDNWLTLLIYVWCWSDWVL